MGTYTYIYIKLILSYTLKMASLKPKHAAVMFPQIIIFYTIKLCWVINLYVLITDITEGMLRLKIIAHLTFLYCHVYCTILVEHNPAKW